MKSKLLIMIIIYVICLGGTAVLANDHDVDTIPNEFVFEAKQTFVIPSCSGDQIEGEGPAGPTACEQELEAAIKNFENEKDNLDRKFFEFLVAVNDTEQSAEFANETLEFIARMTIFDNDLNIWIGNVTDLECSDQVTAFNDKVGEVLILSEDMPDIARRRRRSYTGGSYPVSTKIKVQPSTTTDHAQEIIITIIPQQNKTIEFGEYNIKWNTYIYEVEDIAE